jgi:hypothetical protein
MRTGTTGHAARTARQGARLRHRCLPPSYSARRPPSNRLQPNAPPAA